MDKEKLNSLLKSCSISSEKRELAISHIKEALSLLGLFDKTPLEKQQHIVDTPRRIADVWLEFTSNLGKEPSNITAFSSNNDNIVIVDNIEFHSLCSHHFFPFTGVCHVAYLPDDKIIGLSKIPRVVKHFSKQPQVQENLTDEIVDYLFKVIKPQFILVMMIAKHQCCSSRGVESNSDMVTTARRYNKFSSIDPDKLTKEIMSSLQIKQLYQSGLK